jgi:hypothetical protein
MKESEVKAMFAEIQRKLETLQGSDESFLFFAKRDLRGVLNGDDEDIITLVLFNMIKYDVVAEMFTTAVEKYHNMPEVLKREVRDSKPTHETFTIDNINQIEDENN